MGAKQAKLVVRKGEPFRQDRPRRYDADNVDQAHDANHIRTTNRFTKDDLEDMAVDLAQISKTMRINHLIFDPRLCSRFIVLHAESMKDLVLHKELDLDQLINLVKDREITPKGAIVGKDDQTMNLRYFFDDENKYVDNDDEQRSGVTVTLSSVCHKTAVFYSDIERLFNTIIFCIHTTSSKGVPLSIDPAYDGRAEKSERATLSDAALATADAGADPLDDFGFVEGLVEEQRRRDAEDEEIDEDDEDEDDEDEEDEDDDEGDEDEDEDEDEVVKDKNDEDDDEKAESSDSSDSSESSDNDDKDTDSSSSDDDDANPSQRQQTGGKKGKKNGKNNSNAKKYLLFVDRLIQDRQRHTDQLISSFESAGFSRIRLNQMLMRDDISSPPNADDLNIYRDRDGKYKIDYDNKKPIYITPSFCNSNLKAAFKGNNNQGQGKGNNNQGQGKGNNNQGQGQGRRNNRTRRRGRNGGMSRGGKGKKGKGTSKNGDSQKGSTGKWIPASLTDIKPFPYIEALYYDSWTFSPSNEESRYKNEPAMSTDARIKHASAVRRLADVFSESIGRVEPATFGEIRLRDLRTIEHINYFCEPVSRPIAPNQMGHGNIDILNQPIKIERLKSVAYADKYVNVVVDYLNEMISFEERLFRWLGEIFEKKERVTSEGRAESRYVINHRLTRARLTTLTRDVRDATIDFLICCEKRFQDAMYYYKMLTLGIFSTHYVNRQHSNRNNVSFANRERTFWNLLHEQK